MKLITLLLICWMTVPSPIQAGELYRWVDKDGKVHYGDTPPDDATEVERKKLFSEPDQNTDLPYETRRAQQNFPVTLYVAEGCGDVCNQARGLLNKRGIPFNEKLLRTQKDVDEFKQLSGTESVPALMVGKNLLKGYLDSQWNSELDIAGYPKTASYRQRIATPKKSSSPETPPAAGQPAESPPAENSPAPAATP